MVWVGFGILWIGYGAGIYGWSLLRGYDLSFKDVFSPTGWYSGPWPPQAASPDVVIPGQSQPPGAQLASFTVTQAGTAAGGAPAQPQGVLNGAIIRGVAASHGWGSGGQWNALTHLINGESGGNPTIKNTGSGALGIAQALGHGTSCSGGTLGNEYGPQFGLTCAQAKQANSGNALQQARWMMGYIKATYGSPVNAYNTWLGRSPHWY